MYARILVPVDGSGTAAKGLDEAIKIAKNQGSKIRIVHIVNEVLLGFTYNSAVYSKDLVDSLRESGKKVLAQSETAVREAGRGPECKLVESVDGAAADFIIEQAKEWPADLIVLGTHGRRGLRRLAMGSDAEQVIRLSPVPVLLVRAPSEE